MTNDAPNQSISTFTDDQLREWVGNAVWYANPSNDRWYLAEELLAVRAKVSRFRKALNHIDALDPEWQHIESVGNDAARGLILRMGEIARTALKGGEI
jgi:hypothetical protein